MRLMSLACSKWKLTDLELVAGNNRTGIETSPKVRLAVDIERAGMRRTSARFSAQILSRSVSGGVSHQHSPDLPSYISRRAKSSRVTSSTNTTLPWKIGRVTGDRRNM